MIKRLGQSFERNSNERSQTQNLYVSDSEGGSDFQQRPRRTAVTHRRQTVEKCRLRRTDTATPTTTGTRTTTVSRRTTTSRIATTGRTAASRTATTAGATITAPRWTRRMHLRTTLISTTYAKRREIETINLLEISIQVITPPTSSYFTDCAFCLWAIHLDVELERFIIFLVCFTHNFQDLLHVACHSNDRLCFFFNYFMSRMIFWL